MRILTDSKKEIEVGDLVCYKLNQELTYGIIIVNNTKNKNPKYALLNLNNNYYSEEYNSIEDIVTLFNLSLFSKSKDLVLKISKVSM